MNRHKHLLTPFVFGLLLILFPLAATAAADPPDPSGPPGSDCNPTALRLSQWMGVDCSLLMEYQAQGVGFGVIRKAYSLSQTYPDLNWQQLVTQHMSEEGLGWGHVKQAYGTADAAGPDELVEEGAQGKGWGKTLQKTRVAPGKPPWANGRGKKAR